MKFKYLLIPIALNGLFSCGSDGSKNQELEEAFEQTTDNTESSNQEQIAVGEEIKSFQLPKYIRFGKDRLMIHGKDIWVRSEPAIGKVVMKLNEGDQCTVLEKGFVEMIRGDVDYWYKIEFNEQQGWVFGSQTSYKNQVNRLIAEDANILWEKFKKYNLEWVTTNNTENANDEGWKHVFENKGETFDVNWEGEGPRSATFSKDIHSTEPVILYLETISQEGAAGFTNSWRTYIGINQNDVFTLFPALELEGKVESMHQLSDQEYVIITYNDTGNGVVAFKSTYFNVFTINTSTNSIRRSNHKLGEYYWDMGMEDYAEIGDTLVSKVELMVNDDYSLSTITYRSTKEERQIQFIDKITANYSWDSKTKSYVKE